MIDLLASSTLQTCVACPSQWEGRTPDDRPAYIRFRHGRLQLGIGAPGEPIESAVRARRTCWDGVSRSEATGYMEWDEAAQRLGLRLVDDHGEPVHAWPRADPPY